MKYKVTLKVSYQITEFLFDDRMEALDFMETAWLHRQRKGDLASVSAITESPKLTFAEED